MARFENVFNGVLEKGFDYNHPEYGWPGRALNISDIVIAEAKLILPSLDFEATLTGGLVVAYPADAPPSDTNKPRLIETLTFKPKDDWQPTSMTTVVGARPPAIVRFGRDGESRRRHQAHPRVLYIASLALDAHTKASDS
ncbi:hypothetical protein IRY61_05365 [Candidatus Saccharibacteria bacterium]|nr:hypothetical protein [Candidatus Saccharibacteria bacterium]